MGRVRHRLDDLGQRLCAADLLEIPFGAEPLQHDCGIDPLAGVVEVLEMLEEQPVGVIVKVIAASP